MSVTSSSTVAFYISQLEILGVKVGKIDTVLDANLTDGTVKQVLVRGKDVTALLGGTPPVKVPQGSSIDLVISKKDSNSEIGRASCRERV